MEVPTARERHRRARAPKTNPGPPSGLGFAYLILISIHVSPKISKSLQLAYFHTAVSWTYLTADLLERCNIQYAVMSAQSALPYERRPDASCTMAVSKLVRSPDGQS